MSKRKNPHAVALGRKGGISRLYTITPERRREIASMGGIASAAKKRLAQAEANKT